jgi:hypothetical protein
LRSISGSLTARNHDPFFRSRGGLIDGQGWSPQTELLKKHLSAASHHAEGEQNRPRSAILGCPDVLTLLTRKMH